jgi:hypothetical protein
MKISSALIEFDRACNWVPLASAFSNTFVLFQKCVCPFLPESIQKDRYWIYIKEKDLFLTIALVVLPILTNIFVILTDILQYKDTSELINTRIRGNEALVKNQAERLIHCKPNGLTPDQMMPAKTENQQRLWVACVENDQKTVEKLLAQGVSPNFYHSGQTPILSALLIDKSPEIVTLLMKAGAAKPTQVERTDDMITSLNQLYTYTLEQLHRTDMMKNELEETPRTVMEMIYGRPPIPQWTIA